METFTEARTLVRNDGYAAERQAALEALDLSAVDAPIVDIVEAFRPLPHCFTLQCCYGHFLTTPGRTTTAWRRSPDGFTGTVRYRIAYVAFCVDTDDRGRALLEKLSRVPESDPAVRAVRVRRLVLGPVAQLVHPAGGARGSIGSRTRRSSRRGRRCKCSAPATGSSTSCGACWRRR